MKEIGTRMAGLSTVAPRQQTKNLSTGNTPGESFQPGETAPGLMKKPQFPQNSAAEKAEPSKRGLSTGKTVALIATTLAAGAGVVGLANAHPGPTHGQIQMSERDAHRADKSFGFLSEVVSQQGGSDRKSVV